MNDVNLFPKSAEFLYQLYLPIMIWLVAIIILMIVLIRKYTLGKWTKENPNPYEKMTLGMPEGVFRGIITMTLLYVVVIFETVNIKDNGFEARADMLLVSFQMMIAFYFGSKVVNSVSTSSKKQQTMIDAQPPAPMAGAPAGDSAPSGDPDPKPVNDEESAG